MIVSLIKCILINCHWFITRVAIHIESHIALVMSINYMLLQWTFNSLRITEVERLLQAD
jgi:hypothetical protein